MAAQDQSDLHRGTITVLVREVRLPLAVVSPAVAAAQQADALRSNPLFAQFYASGGGAADAALLRSASILLGATDASFALPAAALSPASKSAFTSVSGGGFVTPGAPGSVAALSTQRLQSASPAMQHHKTPTLLRRRTVMDDESQWAVALPMASAAAGAASGKASPHRHGNSAAAVPTSQDAYAPLASPQASPQASPTAVPLLSSASPLQLASPLPSPLPSPHAALLPSPLPSPLTLSRASPHSSPDASPDKADAVALVYRTPAERKRAHTFFPQ